MAFLPLANPPSLNEVFPNLASLRWIRLQHSSSSAFLALNSMGSLNLTHLGCTSLGKMAYRWIDLTTFSFFSWIWSLPLPSLFLLPPLPAQYLFSNLLSLRFMLFAVAEEPDQAPEPGTFILHYVYSLLGRGWVGKTPWGSQDTIISLHSI